MLAVPCNSLPLAIPCPLIFSPAWITGAHRIGQHGPEAGAAAPEKTVGTVRCVQASKRPSCVVVGCLGTYYPTRLVVSNPLKNDGVRQLE